MMGDQNMCQRPVRFLQGLSDGWRFGDIHQKSEVRLLVMDQHCIIVRSAGNEFCFKGLIGHLGLSSDCCLALPITVACFRGNAQILSQYRGHPRGTQLPACSLCDFCRLELVVRDATLEWLATSQRWGAAYAVRAVFHVS